MDPTSATGGQPAVTVEVPFTPPYAWEPIRAFLAARAIPGVEVVEGDRYRRTFAFQGRQGIVEVSPAAVRPALVAIIQTFGSGEGMAPASLVDEVVRRLRRVFDLEARIEPIEAHLARSPLLAPFVSARPGLRVPGAWDGFELGIRAILGQQITVVGARQLAGKLAARFGEPLRTPEPDGILTAVFPDASSLAVADLTNFGMPGARARAIVGVAEATVRDPTLFERQGELATQVERLRSLPGIGEWSAQYIALRALGERDAFPAADVGLLRAASDADGRRLSPGELLRLSDAWRPWRAYAAQHLWTALTGSR